MESTDPFKKVLTSQGALLNKLEQYVQLLMESSRVMTTQVTQLTH